MELYVTYHKILDLLQQFQESNPVLKSFGYGNLVEFGDNVSGRTAQYPVMYVVPQSITYDQNTTTYQLSLLFADRLNEDKDNEKDAISDMSLVARDFISQVMRGNLMNEMDLIMPVTSLPFMERFNDYVAGVALDAQIVIFEDVNACVEYPTPTPTSTPGEPTPTPTPTATGTPTPTPSLTPTLTPTMTPSPTSVSIDPATLGATWWSQYSNSAFLNLTFPAPYDGNITYVIDGVNGSTFFQNQGISAWDSNIFSAITPNYSGAAVNDAFVQSFFRSQNGDYTNNTTDWTFFARVYYDNSRAFFTEEGIQTSDIAYGDPVRWYQIKVPLFAPNSLEIDVWADPNTASGFVLLTPSFTPFIWQNFAVRAFQDGPEYKVEYWNNGSLITSASTVYTAVPPAGGPRQTQYSPLGYLAEQSWWNRKLTDSEMGQMFTFLTNRYG